MKQKTREKIIKAAITTLATKPYSTLDDIAWAAGVGRTTLFRHFESRGALIREMILEAGKKMESEVAPIFDSGLPAKQKLKKFVMKVIPLGASLNFSVYEPLHKKDPEVVHTYKKYLYKLRGLCSELKKEGIASPDIPNAWLAASLDKLIFTAWENIQSGDIAANDAPNLLLRSYLNGIGDSDQIKK
jgi:AcrR family transcriptional regulator